MEHRALMCTSQPWKGPEGSTFSPSWDAPSRQPTVMMSPCPDVVKSPCQHAANPAHARVSSVTSHSQLTSPNASTSPGWSAAANAVDRRVEREREAVGPVWNEDTVLPAYIPEFRGRSFSAAGGSNPIAPRRRCDSYVRPCPDNSPRDTSQDDDDDGGGTSRLSPNASPEHGGQRSRSRSIILRKTKRRPAPPARSVSLRRDSASQLRDKRTKSLYIDRDDVPKDSFLPDLILVSTPRTEEDQEHSSAQSGRAPVGPPGTSNGQLTGQRSTDLRCPVLNGRSESVRPPLPMRRPPTLISKPSTFQQSAPVSPSGGQSSSQTPPSVVLTSSILGPDPLGCKMRTKSSTTPTSPRARSSRLRLSLELPAVVPLPDPAAVKPKVTRRHSESSGSSSSAARPRQRLTTSMLVMPVVTQEDLSNVRLRSVSSSDSDKGLDGSPEVIREEEPDEDLEACPPVQQSPKAKPPVAAKPPVHKWLPMHMVKSSSASSHFVETPPASQTESQGDMCAVERRAKPKRWHQTPRCASDCVTAQSQPAVDGHAYKVAHPFCHQETVDVRRTESLRDELDKKKKPVPPPVAKKPDVVFVPPVTSLEQESSRGYVWSGSSGVYQDRDFTGQDLNRHRIKDGFFLDENQEEMRIMSEVKTLCLREQEEFDQISSQPTTEDLFTIIHRSKKKLLGRKEAAEMAGNRQGYGSPSKGTQGIVQKSSSKNDNFMAFLQRRRSNKASSGERLSAAELLKSTKPLAGQP